MHRLVVEAVDNNTLVVVLGDHGMTSTGDHGGETSLETDAALLVYSKRPLFDPQQVCCTVGRVVAMQTHGCPITNMGRSPVDLSTKSI